MFFNSQGQIYDKIYQIFDRPKKQFSKVEIYSIMSAPTLTWRALRCETLYTPYIVSVKLSLIINSWWRVVFEDLTTVC